MQKQLQPKSPQLADRSSSTSTSKAMRTTPQCSERLRIPSGTICGLPSRISCVIELRDTLRFSSSLRRFWLDENAETSAVDVALVACTPRMTRMDPGSSQ